MIAHPSIARPVHSVHTSNWSWNPPIPFTAIQDKRLSPIAFRVLAYLAHRCGPIGKTWVSNPTIAEALGFSVDAIRSAIKLLVATGWITRTPDGSVRRGDVMTLAWSPSELLA